MKAGGLDVLRCQFGLGIFLTWNSRAIFSGCPAGGILKFYVMEVLVW